MISAYNKKVTITRPAKPTQTAGGGLVAGKTDECFTKHFSVESKSGSMQQSSVMREWSYDYKLTGRYTKSFIEKGGDLICYDGKMLIVRTVNFDNEGAPREVTLRCSVNE